MNCRSLGFFKESLFKIKNRFLPMAQLVPNKLVIALPKIMQVVYSAIDRHHYNMTIP